MQAGFLRSVLSISFITLLSRITGLVREMVKAAFLGTGIYADAFNLAFTLPNLFRRLTAEGAMNSAFVPIFQDVDSHDKKMVAEYTRTFFWLLSAIVLLICLLFILNADFLISNIFAPGFTGERLEWTVYLTKLMFLYILFISQAALIQSVLNCRGIFLPSAVTPLYLNISIILFTVILSYFSINTALAMSIGVLVGGIIQLISQLPSFYRQKFQLIGRLAFRYPKVPETLKNMLPGILATGVYQINILVGNLIASGLEEGSVSALVYSNRLIELVLGVFIVSITTVIFPGISKLIAEGKGHEAHKDISSAFSMVTLFTLPAMIIFYLIGEEIIEILFQRGAFDSNSTNITFQALFFQIPALIFVGWNRLLFTVFNSNKKYRLVLLLTFISSVFNVVLAVILSKSLNVGGISLAGSVAQFVLFSIMIHQIGSRKLLPLAVYPEFIPHAKLLGAGLAMFAGVYFFQSMDLTLNLFLYVFISILLGGMIFLAAATILRCREIQYLFRFFVK